MIERFGRPELGVARLGGLAGAASATLVELMDTAEVVAHGQPWAFWV
ncbi:hypothetical protein HMPREF0591_1377 [Mycobacterium parascrofulaceum ATCC BAA-614]|uniref:Uncharacterized protein n=1 Tax=Mycobacterium parascrofulaceum ATCC BAA-614 TaxID=525368 RepID=D5P5D3_9MYCO|nr:hypothetical protein HMPREF0591_1377 [Mycobacterium parascrofulaceum ATCC BAA-614]